MKIKNLWFGVLASLALIGCTNDEELPLVEETSTSTVQFALNVEGAVESRAISDGKGADQLMYGVFEKVSDTETKQVITKTVINNVEGLVGDGYRMSISLLRGKTYQVVFWAQDADCEAYTIGNDMKVDVNYNGINNDELRDAFFATQEVSVTSNSTINVTLKRPFAQINVGAFKTDYEHAKTLGLTVNQSCATIKKVPNQIDLLTGVASGEVDVKYTFGNIPNESLKGVDVDGDKNLEIYKWVSMSYILASPERTKHEMNFAFINSADETSQILFEAGKEVPAQRNYRTNIVGQVLSSTYDFNINIDPVYEDEKNNAGYVYYIFNENTTIENTEFALNNASYGNWCVFTAPVKNENNVAIVFDNVRFSGGLYGVMFGEDYRDANHKTIETPYYFTINEVYAENVEVSNCITDSPNHMSILFYLRGESNVTNCKWVGTTTVNNVPIDAKGEYVGQPVDDNVAYDCGIPNGCKSNISDSEIGSIYVWPQSFVTLTGCKVDYIRAGSLYYTTKIQGRLTIAEGTTIKKLDVTTVGNYKVTITIKNGATIEELNMKGSLNIVEDYFIVEPGAKVNGKIFETGMNVKEFLGVE